MAMAPLAIQKMQDANGKMNATALQMKAMKNEDAIADSMGMKMDTEADAKIFGNAGDAMKARLAGLEKVVGAFTY